MPQLPFVVEPRRETVQIGNDDIGILEFPRLRALTNREQVLIDQAGTTRRTTAEINRLTTALEAEGMERHLAALTAATITGPLIGIPAVLTPDDEAARKRHADLVEDIEITLNQISRDQRIRTITALLAYRLPGCRGWTDDDTIDLPEPLLDAVYRFAIEEQNHGNLPQDPEKLLADLADVLGKSREALSLLTPTGLSDSGDAENSGPAALSSAPSDSAPSPSPTPSRRSRKANGA